ncbi:MAG: mechanosensitive ion channel [Gammaproteobacteria bacterium]|nr:mechanosensitive ion channel [Gammaproteobacteria bacterium]
MGGGYISIDLESLLPQLVALPAKLQAQVFNEAMLWQGVGLAAIAGAAWPLTRLLRPIIQVRTSSEREHLDSKLAQLGASAFRLLPVIVFLALTWLSIGVVTLVDPTARIHLLDIVASLLGAWVLIALLSSFIANRLLAKLLFATVWFVAALNILGVLDDAIAVLDAMAIPLGANRLSMLTLINGALLLVALLWLAVFLSGLLQRRLRDVADLSPRAQVLLGKAARFTMIALAVIIALSSVGTNFAALAVFTGALGVGIGIGLQQQVSNLLSGLFLLLDKSIKPGDVIEVGDTFGWVKDMRARYVGVVTRDNKELLIPNDDFVTNQVINWSHSDQDVRMEVAFGVSYNSDPHKVRQLAVQAAESVERVSTTRAPVCHLVAFGDSALDFLLRFWIDDPDQGVTNIKGLVLLNLWDLFRDNDVEIPYPHRQILLRNDPQDSGPVE